MREEDVPAAAMLAAEHLREVIPEFAERQDPAAVRGYFESAVANARPTAFAALAGDTVIGYLTASMRGCTFMREINTSLDAIYVDPAHRGGRAAALLMAEFIGWSEMVGAVGADLATSLAHAERDARFFARFGAYRVGVSMRIKL